ncbi:MAG: HAMP domain-containing protein [Actinobacteria bacterium]|nr:HAMP domain-containing protein [Actinomycetota bacterium]
MSTATTPASATSDDEPTVTRVRFGMRGKMLAAFAVAFTIIFGLLALFVVRFVTEQAQTRLVAELQQTAQGAAETLDTVGLERLLATIPKPSNDFDVLTKDPLYLSQSKALNVIFAVTGGPLPTGGLEGSTLVDPSGARPYTYFKDAADGKLYWMTNPGVVWDPRPSFANPWRGPVADTVGGPSEPGAAKSTYDYMLEGLTAVTNQPSYTDSTGTYISTYAPLKSADGTAMAIGVDYYTSYVDEVRNAALRNILPVLFVGYILLLGLVVLVSTLLTRPLKRLTAATTLIAAGDYDVDLSKVTKTRVPDEMVVLSQSFEVMVDKVRAREKHLKTQVKRLTIEIDAKKREQSVNEITDSDFFSAITAKADSMRKRMDEMDHIDDASPTPVE